jgi:hypothetical protein
MQIRPKRAVHNVESTMASGLWVSAYAIFVRPRTDRNLDAGTAMGPGFGAVPGAGCGKAVDRAV